MAKIEEVFLKTILVTGGSGRIGLELVNQLQVDPRTKDCKILTPGRNDLNQLDLWSTTNYMCRKNPDVVINLAANTNVKSTDYQAMGINDLGTHNLIEASKKVLKPRILFVQGSTNMVFDGTAKRPYKSYDQPIPSDLELTLYAESKLRAEFEIKRNQAQADSNLVYAIVRFAQPVFPEPVVGGDYLSRWAENQNQTIKPFVDQRVSLSYIPVVAKALIDLMLLDNPGGVWHLTSKDDASPMEIVKRLFTKIGRPVGGLAENHLGPGQERSFPRMAALDTTDLERRGITRDLGTIDEIIDKVVSGWETLGLVPWTADKKYSLPKK